MATDPCAAVRGTCAAVAASAAHVRVADAPLVAFADRLAALTHLRPPAWDECGWHYCRDAPCGGPLTAQYVLVLDTLNFCFWSSSTGMEYDALATGLTRVLEADAGAFSAAALSAVDAATLRAWLAPHDVPNVAERVRLLRELGAALATNFDGSAAGLVAAAGQSAVELVRLLVAHCPGFRDEAVYRGRPVFMYKRAQIAAADLWAAYGRQVSGPSPFALRDVHALTCFPDYRLPQLLRHEGVLAYDAGLSALVDARQALPAGGAHEVEIRAATVVVVDRLRDLLNARTDGSGGSGSSSFTAVECDWLLWQLGERAKDAIAPHHRVDTIFY